MATYPTAVISSKYCVGSPVHLTVARKIRTTSEGNFEVKDINDKLIFKVKGKFFSLHSRRVLLDSAGNPIITLRPKMLSMHCRWFVYKGDSIDEDDLIFNVKKPHSFRLNTELDVFLASNNSYNTNEEVCDFKIDDNTIYAGNSHSNIVAQMHKKHNAASVLLGKVTYEVSVCPNVDYAFITALVAIFVELNEGGTHDGVQTRVDGASQILSFFL